MCCSSVTFALPLDYLVCLNVYNTYILHGGADLGFQEDYCPVEVDSSSSEDEADVADYNKEVPASA